MASTPAEGFTYAVFPQEKNTSIEENFNERKVWPLLPDTIRSHSAAYCFRQRNAQTKSNNHMNNTGEQVADDNRKKNILQPVQQRIAFTTGCRLPHPPNGPDDTYNPCPRYRNYFHEDCTLHTCSTEACKDGRKNSKSPSLPPSESSFHRSCFHLSPARQRHSFYLPPSACDVIRLVNGSYLAILHHTVHGAMRIEKAEISK